MGAARGGAGLVEVCVPEAIHPIVAAGCLEVMPTPLPGCGHGRAPPGCASPPCASGSRGADALVIGPGLGRSPDTVSALLELLVGLPCPAVVDADALNIVAAVGVRLEASATSAIVVTPHPAEMARLAGHRHRRPCRRIGSATAERYAQEHGVVVVLKGAETVVAASGPAHAHRHAITSWRWRPAGPATCSPA